MAEYAHKGLVTQRRQISDARTAVSEFLQESLPDVYKLNVTKLVQIDPDDGTWEAEVEVWQPNPTIQALGLPTSKPVLDRHEYLARLDGQLNVIAYGETESVRET